MSQKPIVNNCHNHPLYSSEQLAKLEQRKKGRAVLREHAKKIEKQHVNPFYNLRPILGCAN